MMLNTKYFTLISLQILIPFSLMTGQTEKDSVNTALDSLLIQNVTQNAYINSASRYEQSLSDAPTSTTIINSKNIESFGYTSLLDVLRAMRGLYISYDRQYDALGVRGFIKPSAYNSQILLLLDGHRLNIFDGAPKGNDIPLDMFNLERIEIIKGPGSALYGTNAMLAVINLIPRKLSDPAKPQIAARYGSFDTKRISLNWGGEILKDLSVTLNSSISDSKGEDIYFKEFDFKETNNGIATGLDYESRFGIYSEINYRHFNLNLLSTYRKKGNPTGSFFSKFNAKSETEDETQFAELNYSENISYDKNLSVRGYYDCSRHSGLYYVQLLGINDEGYVNNLVKTAGAEIQLTWDILPNNRLTTGIEYRGDMEKWFYLGLPSQTVLDVNDPSKIFSIYFQNEYQYSNSLSFYFGLRRDVYSPGNTTINPRISLNYAPSDMHVLRLLYGTAFREPNIYEKYYEVPFFYKRNTDLRAESISTTELIWDYTISRMFNTTVSLYYYKMTNLVDAIIDKSDGLFQYKNNSAAETSGIEIGLEANFTRRSNGYVRYSFQNAVDEKKIVLSNSPAHLLKFGFTSPLAFSLNWAFEIQMESERKTIYSNFTDPVLYGTLNLFTDNLFDLLKFSLIVKNIFNTPINYPGGLQLKQDYISQPGRNFLFTIGYGLD